MTAKLYFWQKLTRIYLHTRLKMDWPKLRNLKRKRKRRTKRKKKKKIPLVMKN